MYKYAILMNPGHNRVFFAESKKLSLAELEISAKGMEALLCDAALEDIAGVSYITFKAENKLGDRDISVLSRLSSCYALFEIDGGALIPVKKDAFGSFSINPGEMLKYSGKTNELFTRMLINSAVFSSDFADIQRPTVLDPLAGKGTTLFDCAYCGYNAYGVEIADKTANEAYVFFKKFLESEKFKHSAKKERLSGANKSFTASVYKFSFAKSKELFNSDGANTLFLAGGNSRYADRIFGKGSVHAIVGDLPYGVAHGNVSGAQQGSKTRNPKELLRECLPAWRETLKKGGVIALSWNAFVLAKEEIEILLEQAGFSVLHGGPYGLFEHRVDQAIKRDAVFAKKE